MGREKDVSTRLLRPTLPHIHLEQLMLFVERWDQNWEIDGSIKIYDEGIAQFMLVDSESHYKYYAAVILGKASLRCSLVEEEPADMLDAEANRFQLIYSNRLMDKDLAQIEYLKQVLRKRGYRFDD